MLILYVERVTNVSAACGTEKSTKLILGEGILRKFYSQFLEIYKPLCPHL